MRALLARNERRRARAEAAETAAEGARRAEVARAATRATAPDALPASALVRSSLAAVAGTLLPLAPNARREREWAVPDVEGATVEHEWDARPRVVRLPAVAGGGGAPSPRLPAPLLAQGAAPIDIGPATAEAFAELAGSAGAVLLAGPLGVVEAADGSNGTSEVLEAAAIAVRRDGARAVLVGGSLAAFAVRAGFAGAGWTAMLAEGGTALLAARGALPGIAVLNERASAL
jgi:hypothetical protein